jgi:hypothetical protein
VAFKHTSAEVKGDWYGLGKHQRRGAKPMRVSA